FPGGGMISPGDVLVSNFNDTNNCQGRGTTIIQFTPNNAAAPDSVAPAVPAGAPTGLALDAGGNLFVASTADNAIYKVPNASKAVPPASVTLGTKIFSDSHLRGPLALAFSPLGTLLTANGDAVNGDPTHPS